jgi:hypothetical protein
MQPSSLNKTKGRPISKVTPQIIALDSPEITITSSGDNINALIGGAEFQLLRDGLRDLALEPDAHELAGVFGIELKAGFDQGPEEIAFLLFRPCPPLRLNVLP